MRMIAAVMTAWLVSMPGAAVPASGWALQSMPTPGIPDASTSAMSCTSADACTAVGSYFSASGYRVTLAERWNGTSWTVQPTPNPAGATNASLSGVSCPSASSCLAVGSYVSSAAVEVTLAETWNGTAWTIRPTPNPAGSPAGSELSAVSCGSAGSCVAVGSGFLQTATLAETWNGTAWTIRKTPTPPGASPVVLAGVSCASASSCLAVGSYDDDTGGWTLAETWNGKVWTTEKTPRPSGYIDSALAGVSCTGAGACVAVGDYFTSAQVNKTLAETWNGTSWTVQPTPNPAGATVSVLSGVSCRSAGVCTAVGYSTGSPLAEALSSTAWTIQPTPGQVDGVLAGVSCAGAAACAAAGNQTTATATSLTLAETWNGSTWVVQATPSPAGATYSSIYGVSCRSAGACTAVGFTSNSTGEDETLAEAWNGTSWQVQPTPDSGEGGALSAVSCGSADACVAVGYYFDSLGRQVAGAQSWNGASWKLTTVPQGAESELSGVSCSSASVCMAVGDSNGSTVAESWNGSTWKTLDTPVVGGATFSALYGVSCTGPRTCTAVGDSSEGTLAEAWNGTSWTIQPTPNPTAATRITLSGVSCTASGKCAAVGSDQNSTGAPTPLAEGLSGTTWTIQPVPLPARAEGGLYGLSCTGSACTAVGYYEPVNGEQTTLAEVWSGTSWTRQATPVPAGAVASELAGVSCTGPGACSAAGSYTNATPETLPLAVAGG